MSKCYPEQPSLRQKKRVGIILLCLIIVSAIFLSINFFYLSNISHPRYTIYFDKKINNLSIGAPVIYSGKKVGEIERISLAPSPQKKDSISPKIDVIIFEKILHEQYQNTFKNFQFNHPQKTLYAKMITPSILVGTSCIELYFSKNIYTETEQKLFYENNIIPGEINLTNFSLEQTLEFIKKFNLKKYDSFKNQVHALNIELDNNEHIKNMKSAQKFISNLAQKLEKRPDFKKLNRFVSSTNSSVLTTTSFLKTFSKTLEALPKQINSIKIPKINETSDESIYKKAVEIFTETHE